MFNLSVAVPVSITLVFVGAKGTEIREDVIISNDTEIRMIL